MKVQYDIILILTELYKVVPLKTPNRMDIIQKFAIDLMNDIDVTPFQIDLPIEKSVMEDEFSLCKENLISLESKMPRSSFNINHGNGAPLFSKVLLPRIYLCCGRSIKIKSDFASVVFYDLEYVGQARSYHGKCQSCKKAFYHGYTISNDGVREFDTENSEVLSFNSGIVFSWRLMAHVNSIVTVGTMSFEKVAGCYQSIIGGDVKINPDRFENAWFIYNILKFKKKFTSWPRKIGSKELDVEVLSRSVYQEIKSAFNEKWLAHRCEEPGCKEGVVVIDGNEKLYRYICAAEKTRVLGNAGEVNSYELCINNPARGNQSKATSKYCTSHIENKVSATEEQLDLRPVTRAFSKSITHLISTEEGCKKMAAIQQYAIRSETDEIETSRPIYKLLSRTAGMFYVFRPCGVRLSHAEMYTSESLSDVFIHLMDIFELHPELLKAIVYDRSCDLHPFLERLGREGNNMAARFAKLDYIVDPFHAKGHTTTKCDLSHPHCEYHPKLKKFDKYKGMNHEIAEQSFNVLNGYKYTTRKMSYSKRLLFFKFIDESANSLKFV